MDGNGHYQTLTIFNDRYPNDHARRGCSDGERFSAVSNKKS
jgi:hypothetical protein